MTGNISTTKQHIQRIKRELQAVGAVAYDLWLPESKVLPDIIEADEHIHGIVYGRYKDGRGALVATNKRIFFIDKKPMFLKFEEISPQAVNAVSQSFVGFWGTVLVQVSGDVFTVKTLNKAAATYFCNYVERRYINRETHKTVYNKYS